MRIPIYCAHSWVAHECGETADIWRSCEQCGERWDSISKAKTGRWLWPWKVGVYGDEPMTMISFTNSEDE